MTEHNLFYYSYASFTNGQLPLLKVAKLYFDKLVLLDRSVEGHEAVLIPFTKTRVSRRLFISLFAGKK
jgi:hypothetical protein